MFDWVLNAPLNRLPIIHGNHAISKNSFVFKQTLRISIAHSQKLAKAIFHGNIPIIGGYRIWALKIKNVKKIFKESEMTKLFKIYF